MTNKTIAQAAGLIAVFGLLSRILGFLRDSLISGFYGSSYIVDSYAAAFVFPDLMYSLLVVGALSSAFIPVLSGYLAKGNRKEAWYTASAVINLIIVMLSVITILALIFAPQIMSFYISDAPKETKVLATSILRILVLQPILLSLSGFSMGILNSLKTFGPPAVGSIIYALCVVISGILLNPIIGIKGFAVGVLIGAMGNFLIQIPALRKAGFTYTFTLNFRHPGVRRIAFLAFPMILAFGLGQIPVFVYVHLATALPKGSLASFGFAYKLQQLPIGIFAYSVGLAIFPTLTEAINLNRWKLFRDSFSLALRSIMFVTIPISVGMMILAQPLISVAFQHGTFTNQDTLKVVPALVFLAFGIVEQSAAVILPRTFYALQDTWTPVLLSGITLIVNIVLMYVLIKPLAQGGLALAISLSGIVNMFLLLYFLKRKIGLIDGRRILTSLIKILFASTIMGMAVWLVFRYTSTFADTNFWGSLINLVVGTCVGAAVFLLLAVVLRMQELEFILQIARRKIAK